MKNFRTPLELKSQIALMKTASLVSVDEAARFKDGQLALVDGTLTLKALAKAGEEVTLLSSTVNKFIRRGINDFQDGKLGRINDGGSMVVNKLRISYAAGIAVDDVATKTFKTILFPADIENSVIRIEQGGQLVTEMKISNFLLRGNEAQVIGSDFVDLDSPFVLLAGSAITIKLLRPEGIIGAECFLSCEFYGKKTMPKRN